MTAASRPPAPAPAEGLSRRSFLTRSAAGGAGVLLSGGVTGLFGTASAIPGAPKGGAGYGPLVKDPAGVLSLPAGFRYTIVARTGETTLESGEPTPGAPDGTASFPRPGGGYVLVTNHELAPDDDSIVPHLPGLVYDEQARGGTTTIEVDADGNRIREYVSLAGTVRQLRGRPHPVGHLAHLRGDRGGRRQAARLRLRGGPARPGGEPGPAADQVPRPVRPRVARDRPRRLPHLPHRGRRRAERALLPVDPAGRGAPARQGRAEGPGRRRRHAGGAPRDHPKGAFVPDLSVAQEAGHDVPREWVPVPDRDAATESIRNQFDEITRSRKLEGMWWGDGGAYFVASYARTEDGSAAQHDGQVWFLDPARDTIELKLHFAYTPKNQDRDADGPDNITVSAYGGVIVAEDGEGVQHLVGADERGRTFFFARNDDAEENSEFTGPNFSYDRQWLFANIQDPGIVFAITGPWTGKR